MQNNIMSKFSKKKIQQIHYVSCIREIIIKRDPNYSNHQHWIDTPPENWSKEETELFDTLSEHENMIKQKIFQIIE